MKPENVFMGLLSLWALAMNVTAQDRPPIITEKHGDGPEIEVGPNGPVQMKVKKAENGYEFPSGFPLSAAEVDWYTPTKNFDEGIMEGVTNPLRFTQHWQNEFPWKTGGLDKAVTEGSVKTFTFHKRGKGRIQYWKERSRFFSNPQQTGFHKFRIPVGEIFGEVILVDGKTTEIALLEGTGERDPKFSLYRPFTTVQELRPFLTKEDWRWGKLDNPHPFKVINEPKGLVVEIGMTREGVNEILSRPFVNVIDKPFAKDADGYATYAPTTTQRGSIVGRFSQRGFFTSKHCAACHQTAGTEGRTMDPNPNPDKYGAIRGGGGVFSAPYYEWMREGKLQRVPDPPQTQINTGIYQVKG